MAQLCGLLTGNRLPYLRRGDLLRKVLGPQRHQLMWLPEGHPQGPTQMARRLQVLLVLALVRIVRHKRLLCVQVADHRGSTICDVAKARNRSMVRVQHLQSLRLLSLTVQTVTAHGFGLQQSLDKAAHVPHNA